MKFTICCQFKISVLEKSLLVWVLAWPAQTTHNLQHPRSESNLPTVLQSERSSVFIVPVRTFLWDWSYATGFTRGLDICSNVISCGPERSSAATYLKMRLRFLEKMKGVRRNQCRKIHWEGFSRRVSRLTAIRGGWVMGGKEIKFIGPTESSFRPIYGRRCCNGLNWAWFGLGYPIGPVNLICFLWVIMHLFEMCVLLVICFYLGFIYRKSWSDHMI
jgi:hypothetical protein